MNPEIKTEFGIILDSLNKIKAILEKDPKVKLISLSVYYLLRFSVWIIKFVR